jgi:hypothetical protein
MTTATVCVVTGRGENTLACRSAHSMVDAISVVNVCCTFAGTCHTPRRAHVLARADTYAVRATRVSVICDRSREAPQITAATRCGAACDTWRSGLRGVVRRRASVPAVRIHDALRGTRHTLQRTLRAPSRTSRDRRCEQPVRHSAHAARAPWRGVEARRMRDAVARNTAALHETCTPISAHVQHIRASSCCACDAVAASEPTPGRSGAAPGGPVCARDWPGPNPGQSGPVRASRGPTCAGG